VGTTNRTRLGDYARAIAPETRAAPQGASEQLPHRGFVAAVEPRELAALGRERGVPVMVDEGAGPPAPPPGAAARRNIESMAELVADGATSSAAAATSSWVAAGRSLLGREDLVARCRTHPLYRALRADRAAFAALEGVLRLHRAGAPLPIDRMWPDPAVHRERLERWRRELGMEGVEIVAADAYLGGGAAPEAPIPGRRWHCLRGTACSSSCAAACPPWSPTCATGGSCSTCERSHPRTTVSWSAQCGAHWHPEPARCWG
jgi:L-seryl-tRNA(Ser) seleniumtransferase